MFKYFIPQDFLNKSLVGEFCMEGIKNKTAFQYLITKLIPFTKCKHSSCLGSTIKVEQYPHITVFHHPNHISHEFGDNLFHNQSSNYQVLVFIYNREDFHSLLPYCSKIFLHDIGPDIAFIFHSMAKEKNLEIPCFPQETNDNFANQKSFDKDKEKIFKNFQRSYLCQLIKFKKQSFCQKSSLYRNLGTIGMEFILAVAFITILRYTWNKFSQFENYQEGLKSAIKLVVKFLQDLLTWLMGVPVGFKLNRPLSRVLGQFYMFHVTVWENYMLSVIYPLVPIFVLLIPWLIPFGICFFLCLFLDVLLLISLHMICFYVYASKLYRFQLIIICSLYRLFHGQKWNPFRKRVDTGPLEIDRMFASTLFLALCVFLLPTTAIYYLVFTSFHLLLFVIEYFVSSIVEGVLQFPVFDILMWFYRHPCHKKIIEVQRLFCSESCPVLNVQFHRVSLASLVRKKNFQKSYFLPPLGFVDILTRILKGITFKRL